MPDFTPDQLNAIAYNGQDACVVAGPGSGKTTVLVERYRSLVIDHRFRFSEILAITFTDKAAANMRSKISELFRDNDVRLRELEQAWIYTIHGFCARLLKEHAIAAGIDPRFKVLDARESDELQMECINAALDDLTLRRREEALALIEMLQVPKVAPDLKSAYDAIRSAGMTIAQVRAMPDPTPLSCSAKDISARIHSNVSGWGFQLTPTQSTHKPELLDYAARLSLAHSLPIAERMRLLYKPPIDLRRIPRAFKPELETIREEDLKQLLMQTVGAATAPFRAMIFDVLERFESLYLERKRLRGALDFNDLERCAIHLLTVSETTRDEIRTQFRQIMLDEFQDVNEQQSDLVKLIRGNEVFFAVGDTNQSIYGFRHARPEIFRSYQNDVQAAGKHLGSLMTNFRSRSEILKYVEQLLNSAQGIDPRDLTPGRKFDPKPHPSIEILRVHDQEEDEEDHSTREAKWIAHRILRLHETYHYDFRQFAVLCRNRESMKPILYEFEQARIPYVCGKRQSFLVSREGLDIAAMLSVIANPRDTVSLATVLRSPLVNISDEALLRARLIAGSISSGLNSAAFDSTRLEPFDPEDAAKLTRFLTDLKRWRTDLQAIPLDVLIVRILSDCGYIWAPSTLIGDNIEAFLQLARTRGPGRTLPDFLQDLESIEKGVNTESDLADEDQGNCVQVMTAHAAKGLEFPVTIIASLHQGTRRGTASVSFTPDHGLGMKWRDPWKKGTFDKDSLKDSWARANSNLVRQREEEEANRLLYVAMTRAEDHLILTYTVTKKAQNWASMVDTFFNLADRMPGPEPLIVERNGFAASVFITDTDPPPLSNLSDTRAAESEVEIIARPPRGANDESAVNVTSLAVFASCPRKYYLQRYLGWSPAPLSDNDHDEESAELSAADLGSAVHALLAGKEGAYPGEVLALAKKFLDSPLGNRAQAAPKSGREWEFIAEIEGAILRGSIDLWFEENGEIEIVDYKTDRAVHPENYAPQLALYALAIEKAFGKRPSRAWLHYLRHDSLREVSLDDSALEAARRLIRNLQEAQAELRFDLNEGQHCYSCPFFRTMCPANPATT